MALALDLRNLPDADVAALAKEGREPAFRELVRRAGFETVYEETRGSVDLRDLPAMYGWTAPSKIGAWVCDKASGALARLAQPLGFGNTLFTVARKVPGGSDRTLGEPAGWRNGARG